MNAVSKQNIEDQMTSLSSDVNSLESQYFSLENGISMDLAMSRGFVQVSSNQFAIVEPAQKALSLSINEN
jgi:hypothetical protein